MLVTQIHSGIALNPNRDPRQFTKPITLIAFYSGGLFQFSILTIAVEET